MLSLSKALLNLGGRLTGHECTLSNQPFKLCTFEICTLQAPALGHSISKRMDKTRLKHGWNMLAWPEKKMHQKMGKHYEDRSTETSGGKNSTRRFEDIKLNDHASPGHASPTTSQPENRLEGRTIVDDLLTVRFWGNWVGFLRGQCAMISWATSKKHQGRGAFGQCISPRQKKILLLMPPGMYKTLQIGG